MQLVCQISWHQDGPFRTNLVAVVLAVIGALGSVPDVDKHLLLAFGRIDVGDAPPAWVIRQSVDAQR
ncbi:hypothetical protein CAP38_09255 [Hydrogenophaga sp. IBVHS2]|nr:hypothetical protein CAP38_09255 [Hydrogenophaga sp. IBVHS2]